MDTAVVVPSLSGEQNRWVCPLLLGVRAVPQLLHALAATIPAVVASVDTDEPADAACVYY